MSNPIGTVQSLHVDNGAIRAIVTVDESNACPRCAAGNGCGAGLFTGTQSSRTVEATAAARLDLRAGDSVELRLAASNLLSAAVIVYGIPTAGAIAAAILAWYLRLGDAAAALAAIAGLTLGLAVSRWKLKRSGCINEFMPHIEKRLQYGPD